jgi:DNA polymerase III epsilon subunit-like protein
MVHQHFMLVPVFTVAENVVLGVEPVRRAGFLDMETARADVRRISDHYGLKVDPEALVEDLLPELAGRAIVAHAAAIERSFLAALLRRLGGVPLPNPFIDTMALERHLVEGGGGKVREMHGDLTLDACRERRGLPDHQRHSAGADAVAAAELLLAQVAQLGGAEDARLRDLL